MAVGRLAETLGAANTAAGNYDIAVSAPAATPNGVCVVIVQGGSTVDNITSVTYGTSTGAVPLTERRFQAENTEAGAVWVYWAAGVVFPSGAQTCRIVRAGTTDIRAAVCPMTCAAGMQIAVDVDSSGVSASVVNPSWAMTTTDPATVCYEGIHSGLNTMTSTPATNWTLIGWDDIGLTGRGWAYRVMTSAGDALPGWTAATADDYVGVSVAFKEAAVSSSNVPIVRRVPRPVEQHTVVGAYAPTTPSTLLGG